MKKILFLIVMIFSINSFAETYVYKCIREEYPSQEAFIKVRTKSLLSSAFFRISYGVDDQYGVKHKVDKASVKDGQHVFTYGSTSILFSDYTVYYFDSSLLEGVPQANFFEQYNLRTIGSSYPEKNSRAKYSCDRIE